MTCFSPLSSATQWKAMYLNSNLKSHIFILISETGKEKGVTLEEKAMVLSIHSFFSNSDLRDDFNPFSANFPRSIGDHYETPSDFPLAGFMWRMQNTNKYLYWNVLWWVNTSAFWYFKVVYSLMCFSKVNIVRRRFSTPKIVVLEMYGIHIILTLAFSFSPSLNSSICIAEGFLLQWLNPWDCTSFPWKERVLSIGTFSFSWCLLWGIRRREQNSFAVHSSQSKVGLSPKEQGTKSYWSSSSP